MDELVKKITPLGLTDKEARVYLALLQLGQASAYSVAIKSGLKKPTAYVILDELIEKGLAYHIPKEKKQLYAATNPEEFIHKAEGRFLVAKKVLPELLSLFKNKRQQQKARTLYFDGLSGMRQGLWYKEKELRGKELVGFFASARHASPEVYKLFDEWNSHYISHDIRVRGLTTYDESLKDLFEKYGDNSLKDIRILPDAASSPNVSIDAGEDFVRIDLIGAEQIVIVESVDFAQAFKQIFELAWQYFPDTKKISSALANDGVKKKL